LPGGLSDEGLLLDIPGIIHALWLVLTDKQP
jgi:hypothetical protein